MVVADIGLRTFMNDNPYSSPSVDSSLDTAGTLSPSPPSSTDLAAIAKPTFLAWERLRILFIVVLGVLTLVLSGPSITNFPVLVAIAEGAVIANICYFAGPIVETYIRWLGYDRKWVRWFLFVGGTILTAILLVVSLGALLLPNQL